MTRAAVGLSTRWRIEPPPDPAAARALAEAIEVPLPLASLLVQRGFTNPDDAKQFLRPDLARLSDPLTLHGMAVAVGRIAAAVRSGQTILVHGDYDVDGQSATALLTRVLREAGAKVEGFVPHRMTDGYDFGPAGLARAEELGASLIVTCDCGITAVEAVDQALAAGRDVVITDHHLPGPVLPRAVAVVDPQLSEDHSGLGMLCGTGIAFKLAQALVQELGLPETLPLHFLDLVALATVADVVPLIGENRILVRHGLRLLEQSRWPGVRALLARSGLEGKRVRAGQVGFTLAPRLNAAGRVGDASDGLRLLLTDDPGEAARLADRLEVRNAERQELDSRILEEALDLVASSFDPDNDAAFVFGADHWHPGVVGIVASRVVERYGRPTFLVGFDGATGKGSGRSISRFDLHSALTECADLLDRFGGHKMAAGLTVSREKFEEFRDRFRAVARDRLNPADLGPEQRVDLEIQLDDATEELERLGRHLEPCGMGNPAPVFGVRGVRLTEPKIVGQGHLKGVLHAGSNRLEAIGFGLGDQLDAVASGAVDIAIRLEQNQFRGNTTLQARLLSLDLAGTTVMP